ncbi:hypothetical protein CARUB_v10008964mg, partial [Capsella rubella]
ENKQTCKTHLSELESLSSSLSATRRRALLLIFLKESVSKINTAMTSVRQEETSTAKENLVLVYEMWTSAKDGIIDSMEELRRAGEKLSPKSYANIHTWLSSVLTSHLTSLDETYEGPFKRNVGSVLEDHIARARVALAIFTSISPRHSEIKSTSVVPDHPSWLSDGDKKNLNLSPQVLKHTADVVVAKDGSGNYRSINEAIAAAPRLSAKRFVVYVKKGIYVEIVNIATHNITLIGDGPTSTILTGSLNRNDGTKTFNTATLASNGDGFWAIDMCFRNTAGPTKGPAVALRVSGDISIIYRCRIEGYQDALYPHRKRQFYRECYITGTVDFICGFASAVFQYCTIVARKPMNKQANMITAQARPNLKKVSGFTFQKCNITASADLANVKTTVKTYLGRPWSEYATVAFIESYIDDLVDPAGWAEWNGKIGVKTFYREYDNHGSGADTSRRVKWTGFKATTDPKEVTYFTVTKLLQGELWLNATGVPYEGGF